MVVVVKRMEQAQAKEATKEGEREGGRGACPQLACHRAKARPNLIKNSLWWTPYRFERV